MIERTASITTSKIQKEINPEVLEEFRENYSDMIKPCEITSDMMLAAATVGKGNMFYLLNEWG